MTQMKSNKQIVPDVTTENLVTSKLYNNVRVPVINNTVTVTATIKISEMRNKLR